MINSVKSFGKFLDQPMFISKLEKHMPKIVATGAMGFLAHDTYKKSKEHNGLNKEDKKNALKKGIILSFTVTSALLAPKIASKITNRAPIDSFEKIKEKNRALVDSFISGEKLDEKTLDILKKAKEKPLSFKNVKLLIEKFKDNKSGKNFMEKLIPDPENIKAKDIFAEIGYLSIFGAIPVLGGILGGIAADSIVEKNWKKNIDNKIDEGIYQYLANIFMCNIGAGCALGILEKMNIQSKTSRAIGMTAGIILTGVLGGSKIANFISKKIIRPIISPNKEMKERKPEPMDLCLHTDDIATVSLLSGLKWIEPALPILYSVSGYKAGIGYRNNNDDNSVKNCHHKGNI